MNECERCTVMSCYYNDDGICYCCDDVRNNEMLENCPSFIED